MLSKFSVKKPLTVLVAVILVLILGVVSFMKMTPDLLPNMEFPYVIIMTTYPGASPETVEEAVSKPLEKSMATLDKIKDVTSTSSENYSMVMLEFNDDVNMDSITVDINDKISAVKGVWTDETIGSPYILKINPNMLPVAVAAVDIDDKDTVELSSFVNDNVIPKLEGVEGVANVNVSGIVDKQVNVKLSQEKIDAVNEKVQTAINQKFADGEDELDSSKSGIEDGLSQIDDGKEQIADNISQLEDKQGELNSQLSQAKSQLDSKQIELVETKLSLVAKLSELENQKSQLSATKEQLEALLTPLLQLEATEKDLQSTVEFLTNANDTLTGLNDKATYYNDEITAINNNPDLSADEKQLAITDIKNSDDYKNMIQSYTDLDNQLSEYGYTREQVSSKLIEATAALALTENGLQLIDKALGQFNMSRSELADNIAQINEGITAIDSAIPTLNNTLAQLEAGQATITDAKSQLNEQSATAASQMGEGLTKLIVADSSLDNTRTQLNSAMTQIDTAVTELDSQKEKALSSADMTKTITMDMVSKILTAQNFSMPAGYVSDDGVDYLVRVGDKIEDENELKNLMLFNPNIEGVSPIFLSDVADILVTDNSNEIYAKINKNNGVLLSFTKQSTYATATVSTSISDKLKALELENPSLHFTIMMDQGDYIYLIVNSVLQNLLFGAVLAIIILLFFLKDIKPTIIIACSIPLSVVFAIVLMYFSGVTLNIISLSGLAVGVGMLVDNSVVVIENIYRLRNKGVSSIKAAVSGAAQVAGAITASTLTTVCVFLPIVFITGITRQLFSDMALTVGYSLIASLIVALTLVPAMSQKMLKKTTVKEHKLFDKFVNGYEKTARFSLRHRMLTIMLAFVLLVVSLALTVARGFTFMPEMDSTSIEVTAQMPKDNTFEESTQLSDDIVAKISEIPEVNTVGAMAGDENSILGMGGSSQGASAETITMYVLTDENKTRTNGEIAKEIEEKCKDFPCTITALGSSSMTSLTAMSGSGVSLKLYGDDLDKLQEIAKSIGAKLETVDGTADVDNGIKDTTPELRITVNKDKATTKGLTVAQVYADIAAAIKTKNTATNMTIDKETTDVIVVNGSATDMTPDDIKDYKLTVTNQLDSTTSTVKLKDIAEFTETTSLNAINRDNQRRYITITANVQDEYNITLVNNDVKEALSGFDLPDDMTIEYSGESESIMDSMFQLLEMLLLAVAFIYLIMVAQFQSLLSPFIVMFTIPLAFTGGLIALLITGNTISVISMIGFVMLAGIIVNNGIVLIDYINQLRAEGVDKTEAIITAARTRMRPILMTVLTTVLGLCVMAVGVGTGSEMMQPIAIVCIGGLIYATLMTLYVVPAAYSLFNRKEIKVITKDELEVTDE